MINRRLGKNGPEVSALGLGCMGMSAGVYGQTDDAESVRTIQAALDAGVTMLDTGDYYGMGHNEMLIGDAIRGRRDHAFIAVKFGALRDANGNWIGFDTRPGHVKTYLAYTLRRLRVDHIDLYQPGRLDPNVPIEETIGAVADCVKAGWVRSIGLSEVGPETIRRAHAVHPIAALQIEYGVLTRNIEEKILPVLRELGIAVTAYGVLSRGLVGGRQQIAKGDMRTHHPRFAGENLTKNRAMVEGMAAIAAELGVTVAQLAIAWALSRGDDIIPLVGAKDREQLATAVAATALRLSPDVLRRIDEATAGGAAGPRYPAQAMAQLDSEK